MSRASAPSAVLTIGRAHDNRVVLDDPRVSSHHARLTMVGSAAVIEDLGSANGTAVGRPDHKVRRGTVSASDMLFFGPVQVSAEVLLKQLGVAVSADAGGTWLEARDVAFAVKGKTLIEGITLTLAPGELVGMMGLSGAGKTTLLNVLSGLTAPANGQVVIDGLDLYRHHDRFRRSIGFVPQDDVMHRELTVRQALRFAGSLRTGGRLSGSALERRIDEVLASLGIEGIDDVVIGSPVKKGISGGQRKRVNVAMELIDDPDLLFLDEPTSGLSSEDALQVVRVLRELADRGKTILFTLHTPGPAVFRLLHRLVLLSKDSGSGNPGRLVYAGSAWPGAVDHFVPGGSASNGPSADEVMQALESRPTTEWLERWRASAERATAERPRSERVNAGNGLVRDPGGLRQWLTLVRRSVAIKIGDRLTTLVHLLQAPLIAALVVVVFGERSAVDEIPGLGEWQRSSQAVSTTLFLLIIAAIWFGCSNAAREIVAEWSVYRRERMVVLSIPAYVASKITVLGGLCAVQCLVLLAIVHPGSHLWATWGALVPVLLLAGLVGTLLGLAISAMAPTSEVAIYLVPLAVLPMVVLGGMIQPAPQMRVPERALAHLSPSHWAFEGVLSAEADARPRAPEIFDLDEDRPPPDLAEAYFPGDSRSSRPLTLGVLGGMVLLLVTAISAVLVLRDVRP